MNALDGAARRFVDLAMTGDLAGALQAFIDAQAEPLEQARQETHLWVARELQAARLLPDDVGPDRAARLLASARRVAA